MRAAPLWTGKVMIGGAYVHPLQNNVISHDSCLLQRAFLSKGNKGFWSFLSWLV